MITSLWASSAWEDFGLSGDKWLVRMHSGIVQIAAGPSAPLGWNFYTPYRERRLDFLVSKLSGLPPTYSPSDPNINLGVMSARFEPGSTGQIHYLNITGWALALPPLIIGVWLVRERRWPIGCCQRCGYDRSGIAANVPCPECGAAAPTRLSTAGSPSPKHGTD